MQTLHDFPGIIFTQWTLVFGLDNTFIILIAKQSMAFLALHHLFAIAVTDWTHQRVRVNSNLFDPLGCDLHHGLILDHYTSLYNLLQS